ncbi:hypothetical protein E3N88_36697 [Mikania micrantha]|uniref:Uncharacterized protein n=1 Tax=Mikania micrantha TaxID=192012 RepID=A0A5N6M4M6_9ASTR|nr:hypothetical protein E3N88_36697 [Mikania micrantha]
MAEVPKAEEITHLPTGQLQGLKNCIDSNSSWVQYEVNAIAEVENILCIEMKGMILLSLEGKRDFLLRSEPFKAHKLWHIVSQLWAICSRSEDVWNLAIPMLLFITFSKPIALIWAYAHLLTTSGAYKHHPVHTQMHCRTDEADLISAAPWIKIPYPLLWGAPTFEVGHAFGKFGALFASIPFPIFAAAYCVLFGCHFCWVAGFAIHKHGLDEKLVHCGCIFLSWFVDSWVLTASALHGHSHTKAEWSFSHMQFNAFFNTIFFSSPMVTLMVVVFLDNTLELKDNAKDRGMPWWAKFRTFKGDSQNEEFYTLPFNLDRFFPPS